MLMSAAEYRDSLRRMRPVVYVDGRRIASVADEPLLAPGVNALGVSYDFALREATRVLMRTEGPDFDGPINRMLAIPRTSADLLNKLEAVRLVCQETGCAERYLAGDALAAIFHGTTRIDAEAGTDYHPRLRAYLGRVYANDLTLGIAMTDAKGDRSLRPAQQPNPDTHVHIVEHRADGIVVSGTKAIVTAAPYVHELLVMPGRNMNEADRKLRCAVPSRSMRRTHHRRPARGARGSGGSFSGNTASRPAFACSIAYSCRGSACSAPENGGKPAKFSTTTPHSTGIPASGRARVSAIC
jgi:4-hydroxybutyryl-CoA dehydratase/vinylacetyl-CoA-Delta-isomerase